MRKLLQTTIGAIGILGALALVGCSGQIVSVADGGTAVVQPLAVSGATLSKGPLAFPADFMTSVKTYGAVGDGVTDDTAAIQRALSDGRSNASTDYNGLPKALYFPPGTYLVSNTLQWVGCCVTLQGAGSSSSVIRLAPGSNGFNNSASPKSMMITPLGNESFKQNVWDIGLTIGSGNPGATAINYVSNNIGSIHNVLIKSEDGKGHAGIDLTRLWAGPLMIRNTEVQGFDVGMDLMNADYSITMEGITVQNQNIAGIRNNNQSLSIRGLTSTNKVPAITNTGGFVVLIDGSLSGGVDTAPAIQTNNSMYLRNVASTGYQATLLDSSTGTPSLTKGTIAEHLVGSPATLTGTLSSASLKLPVEETPSFTSSSLADWASFIPRWYGDTAGLQAVLNSGKHTVYFPFARYFSNNETDVTVPDTVDRIVGFSSIVNIGSGTNGGGIRFVVTSNSTQPLVIEQFGYGIKIDQRGSRPIVLKDAHVYDYESYAGAGKLFLEDIGLNGTLNIQKGQQVWARQFNDEFTGTKISNQGGLLWLLGLKTEQASTIINTGAGGQTELLGALIYPAVAVPSSYVAFLSTDAQVSYMYKESVYVSGYGYSVQAQETRSGVTKKLTSTNSSLFRMPLFVGYK